MIATAPRRKRPLTLVAASLLVSFAPPALGTPYQAEIIRTAFGIPHITADDFGSLGFGAAHAQAQDNICLMAESYVSVAGERSKYFGASQITQIALSNGTNLENDIYYRAMQDDQHLIGQFMKTSTEHQALVHGWRAGYNQFIAEHDLPAECDGEPWVRPIALDDQLRLFNAFAMTAGSGSLATTIANAAPPNAPAHTTETLSTAVPPAPLPFGSNGWAFGAETTANETGLLIANPHYPWFGWNRFYQMQLTIPGEFDVHGVGITNHPYIMLGFNRDVAWTHTVDTAVHLTLFRLELDPSDPQTYLVDGETEQMTQKRMTIEDREGVSIEHVVYTTRFGPVIALPDAGLEWTDRYAYALADPNNGNMRVGDTALSVASAASVGDIHDAIGTNLGVPFFNSIAADRHGDTLYADISVMPNLSAERHKACAIDEVGFAALHLDNTVLLDGSRSECDWQTGPSGSIQNLLPAEHMATVGRRDYVQNSNDSYRLTHPDATFPQLPPVTSLDPDRAPNLRTRYALMEIERTLAEGPIDGDGALGLMLSNRSLAVELALKNILLLCGNQAQPMEACAALSDWDGTFTIESRGAALFGVFWSLLTSGDQSDLWAVPFDPSTPLDTPRTLDIDGNAAETIVVALERAAQILNRRGVPLDAPLGDIQFANRNAEHIPIPGAPGGGVLNLIAATPVRGGSEVVYGSSYIQAVTFDEEGPIAQGILAYSQSANPASPHFLDQTRKFSTLALHPLPFTAREIEAAAIGDPETVSGTR